MTETELFGQCFVKGAMEESFEINRARLEEAVLADFMYLWERNGYDITLNPATVWYTYLHHPELHRPEERKTIESLGRRLLNL